MSNTAGAVPSSLVALTRVLAAKLDDAGWDAVTLSIGKCTLSFNFTIITHKLRRQETFKVASSAAVAAVVVPSHLVAGWAGAIFEVTRSFGQEQWGQRNKIIKKSATNQPTNRPTDKAGCRVTCTRLKTDTADAKSYTDGQPDYNFQNDLWICHLVLFETPKPLNVFKTL